MVLPTEEKKGGVGSIFQSVLDREVARAVRVRVTEKQPRPLTTAYLSEVKEGIYFNFYREIRCCLVQF